MPLVTRLTPKSLNTQQPNRCYDLHIYTTSNYQHRLYEPSNDTNQSINHDYYLFCVFSVYAIVGGCRRRWSLRCGKVDRTIPIYVLVHRAIITVSRMPECRRPRTGGGGKVVFAPANGTLKRNVSDVALQVGGWSGGWCEVCVLSLFTH
jgi:hypothetical protein